VTPAARAAAAIAILDSLGDERGVEAVLRDWGRGNRYAGSSDRSAIRDIVYDVLRRRRSLAAWGGGTSGRSLVLGLLRADGTDPTSVFGAGGYAPPALSEEEASAPIGPWPAPVALDCPDFVWPMLRRALGAAAVPVLRLLQRRAPVHIRANLARVDAETLAERLRAEGVAAVAHPLSSSALEVTDGARRLRASRAFAEGLFEMQDAGSQAVADAVPVQDGARVLDYCAGAGGKTLAMAGRTSARWFAHDADPARMRDLPERAARAGCDVTVLRPEDVARHAPFDVVLVDAPCSGTGAWRRDPEARWRLTPARLETLREAQAGILDAAAALAADDGVLAYATCSLLDAENGWQVDAFRRRHRG
jgi:16S rRNA (cytosine967-C5)-methyltransferase